MMLGRPFFDQFGYDDYYDDDYGYYGYHNNQRRRQAAAAAEARRRAEIERYHRMKELEEQERLRQRQAYLRKLRRQQEEEEEYRRRQRAMELERTRRTQAEHDDEEDEPRYALVRGPDGRIYRVPLDQNGHLRQPKDTPRSKKEDDNTVLRTKIPISSNNRRDDENHSDNDGAEKEASNTKTIRLQNEENKSPSVPITKPKSDVKKKSKKRVTVIVEDASDSETEDDETKSYWRNRRPSPGQWMEPVEGI